MVDSGIYTISESENAITGSTKGTGKYGILGISDSACGIIGSTNNSNYSCIYGIDLPRMILDQSITTFSLSNFHKTALA